MIAAKEGNISQIRQLVQHHAFPINCKLDGLYRDMGRETTVLHASARWGQTETVIALVREFAADLNARDEWDKTAINCALEEGKIDTVIVLVREFGADVNARDKFGKTALHRACLLYTSDAADE